MLVHPRRLVKRDADRPVVQANGAAEAPTAASATRSLEIARQMIVGKIRNSRTPLRRNARVSIDVELERLKRAAVEAGGVERIDSLLRWREL